MRVLWSIVLVALAFYVGLAFVLYVFQASYIYFPTRALAATPRYLGLEFDDVRFTTRDGVALHGWFVPAPDAALTLLFLHGNAGNISDRLDSLRIFHRLGLSTFIFDYRGYGQSEGEPTEQGTYEDAMAAWRYLIERRGATPEQLVLFGRSLGGTIALWLATQSTPRATIVESTFTSVPDMAERFYPYLPVRFLARYHYDALRHISSSTSPLLIVHSRDDEIVPFEQGRRLFRAAYEPKTFLELRGGHNDGFLLSEDHYVRGIATFIASLQQPTDLHPAPVAPSQSTSTQPKTRTVTRRIKSAPARQGSLSPGQIDHGLNAPNATLKGRLK
jgi:fermentation-respiration switch protein FrsA (DUF1100 family)